MSIIKSQRIKILVRKFIYSPTGSRFFSVVCGRIYSDYLVNRKKKQLVNEAIIQYNNGSELGSFKDYKNALDRHWVSYSEYAFQYDFYRLTEVERKEFVSRLKMDQFYWRYVPRVDIVVFRDKPKFLNAFKKYVFREWLYVPDSTYEKFVNLVTSYDCIVKPTDGTCGMGIFKIFKNSNNEDGLKHLYNTCKRNRFLVEQCIEECDELKAFHPSSLNSIRVVTIANDKMAEVVGSFFRMGVGGNVVDNAHAGGLFAQININDGVIESDAIDVSGRRLKTHPDSGMVIKGYRIPHWDRIVNTCCEAAQLTNNPITGWDVVINKNGNVEFVEGNHAPDFDVMQSPLKTGMKKRLFSLIDIYYGVKMN